MFDEKKDIVFRLYTRQNMLSYYVLKAENNAPISDTTFDPKRPTRIFVHGYKSKEKVLFRYRDAYLSIGDYNFIAVDWIKGAHESNYFKSRSRVKVVGY